MRNLRTEDEIIANWKGDIDKPVVSICCITYNHEPYIEDALEGFLIQETDFPFEILIHDDASTDRTADIIREYEAKYPRLINPIYQTENQYSKGVRPNTVYNFPRSAGEFIAWCEGDDYWVAAEKLQVQVLEMKARDSLISFHSVQTRKDNEIVDDQNSYEKSNYSLMDTFLKGHHFIQTCSLVFKTECILSFDKEIFRSSPVGDVLIRIFCGDKKGIDFIKGLNAVYRVQSMNSWTSSIKADSAKRIAFFLKLVETIENLLAKDVILQKEALYFYKKKLESEAKYSISLKEFYFSDSSSLLLEDYRKLTGVDLNNGYRKFFTLLSFIFYKLKKRLSYDK